MGSSMSLNAWKNKSMVPVIDSDHILQHYARTRIFAINREKVLCLCECLRVKVDSWGLPRLDHTVLFANFQKWFVIALLRELRGND